MKKSFLFLVALTGLSSCSKHNDPPATPTPPALSRTELLTAKPWKLMAHREVTTPQSGGAAVVRDFPVVLGSIIVAYKNDGTTSAGYPLQQGTPVSGGSYALTDSVLWTNTGAGSGIIRELTMTRLILVNKWQNPTENYQRTEVFID